MRRSILILLLTNLCISAYSQSSHSLLRDGDFFYGRGDFSQAEEQYRKANEKETTINGSYNLGNTLYEQERFDEAIQQFQDATTKAENDTQKSMAYHNLGNAYFNGQKFKESLEAYKEALRYNSADDETKENLMAARMMLKQMQQQQQQQQQGNEQQEQEQKEQEQQQQEEQQSGEQQQQEPEGSTNVGEKQDLDKEDAKKLREIVDNEEQKVQEKLRKVKGGDRKQKKDW